MRRSLSESWHLFPASSESGLVARRSFSRNSNNWPRFSTLSHVQFSNFCIREADRKLRLHILLLELPSTARKLAGGWELNDESTHTGENWRALALLG